MRRRLIPIIGVAVLAGTLVAQTSPAEAFLDFLFGRPQAPTQAPAPTYSSRPLDISVRPKRGAQADRNFRHKREMGRRHAEGERKERKGVRQVSIDPEANPDWYLKDTTLRYGDILVLKTGPVVYQGSRRARAGEDFVSLGQSQVLSRSRLRDVRMMVSGVWTPPEEGIAEVGRKRRRARR